MVAAKDDVTPDNVTVETFLPPGSPALLENQMLSIFADREVVHALPYGDPGSEKSTFAASFPKPEVVLFFDPYGKGGPYRRRGTKFTEFITTDNPQGLVWHPRYECNFEFIMSKREPEKCATVLIHFSDPDIRAGAKGTYAAEKCEHVLLHLLPLLERGGFATIVLDSLTTFEVAVRKMHQYKLNPFSKRGEQQDARQWYGASAEALEEICFALVQLPCNVVAPGHVREAMMQMNQAVLWMPEAPGKRSRLLPAGFNEVYHIYFDEEHLENRMQCRRSSTAFACTQLNLPNGIYPEYESLFIDYSQPQGDGQ